MRVCDWHRKGLQLTYEDTYEALWFLVPDTHHRGLQYPLGVGLLHHLQHGYLQIKSRVNLLEASPKQVRFTLDYIITFHQQWVKKIYHDFLFTRPITTLESLPQAFSIQINILGTLWRLLHRCFERWMQRFENSPLNRSDRVFVQYNGSDVCAAWLMRVQMDRYPFEDLFTNKLYTI